MTVSETPISTLAVLTLELASAILALHIYHRLSRVSRAIGEKAINLAALGFLVYSIALIVEAIGNIYAITSLGQVHANRPVPDEGRLTGIFLNRGTMIALPVYTVSYVLLAASIYTEHARLPSTMAAIPLVLSLYIDQNLVNLIVLSITATLTLHRYGKARLAGILFYALTGASHLTAIMAVALPEHWKPLLTAAMLLRALAVPVFLATSGRGR